MTLNTDRLNRTVFISDNLPFLKSLDTESVDLVVIDPPFGKNQTFTGNLRPPLTDAELEQEYDLLSGWGVQNEDDAYEIGVEFPDQSGTTAQFRDIWNFRYQVTETDWKMLDEVCRPARLLIETTRYTHSESTAAYIAFMTMRMIELQRILKPTGGLYLHCDHEANAYLRQMMDAVFGPSSFRNEIIWRRYGSHNDVGQGSTRFGQVHDTILVYGKSQSVNWNQGFVPLDDSYVQKNYRHVEEGSGRRFTTTPLTGPGGAAKGNPVYDWNGHTRAWRYNKETMQALHDEGRLYYSKTGYARKKLYLDESKGVPIQDVWTDIRSLAGTHKERTGYPTQKPQALARRIIEASSNPDDLILDCFAGCAYVPVAAELTGRRWIACDMSPRAWTVVRRQFHKQPDLRIVTEGEYTESDTGVQPDLSPERIIRVRGPHDLPKRTTNGQQRPLGIRDIEPIQFRQRPVEDSQMIWEAFVEEWGTRCWYCGMEKQRSRRELQLDHVEPNKRDGSNDDCWNRALACIDCNGDKGDRLTANDTINLALEAGRIATPALRDEQIEAFKRRRKWAHDRWQDIRPLRSES